MFFYIQTVHMHMISSSPVFDDPLPDALTHTGLPPPDLSILVADVDVGVIVAAVDMNDGKILQLL